VERSLKRIKSIKAKVTSKLIMAIPDPEKQFKVEVDVS